MAHAFVSLVLSFVTTDEITKYGEETHDQHEHGSRWLIKERSTKPSRLPTRPIVIAQPTIPANELPNLRAANAGSKVTASTSRRASEAHGGGNRHRHQY